MGTHYAVQDFHALAHEMVPSSDPRVKSVLQHIEPLAWKQLEAASAESIDFFRLVGDGLLRLRGFAQLGLRTSCLHACSHYLYVTGKAGEALPFALHGLSLSQRNSNESVSRRFFTLLGAIYGELGSLANAIESHHRALELAIQKGDLTGEIVSWNNLSANLLDSGMYVEAISAGRKAIGSLPSVDIDQMELRARCESNIALAFLRLGEIEAALQYGADSIFHSIIPKNGVVAQGRIVRETNFVRVLVEAGKISVARQHSEFATQLAGKFPNGRSRVLARMCAALLEVLGGDADKGIAQLEALKTDSSVIETPPIHNELLLTLAKAYEAVGRHESALVCLETLTATASRRQLSSVLEQLSSISKLEFQGAARFGRANLRHHEMDVARLKQLVANQEVLQSRLEMLERMAIAVDIREDISGEHGFRVGRLSSLLAKEIGWDKEACGALDISARLHDIGKIGIPERILLGERALRDSERQLVCVHTSIGAEILSKSDIPQVRIAEEIARCHHEWWDGTGYPKQLKGKDIPRSARIVALADVFDAMTHGRPYAPARPVEEALDLIAGLRGRQFDPELTDHFLALVRRLVRENENLDAYLGKAARHSPFLKARARIKELLSQERDSTAISPSPRPPGATLN